MENSTSRLRRRPNWNCIVPELCTSFPPQLLPSFDFLSHHCRHHFRLFPTTSSFRLLVVVLTVLILSLLPYVLLNLPELVWLSESPISGPWAMTIVSCLQPYQVMFTKPIIRITIRPSQILRTDLHIYQMATTHRTHTTSNLRLLHNPTVQRPQLYQKNPSMSLAFPPCQCRLTASSWVTRSPVSVPLVSLLFS
jgi:hypothetical protein